MGKIDSEVICEAIMSLVGPVDPVGCSNVDRERLGNIVTLGEVVNELANKLWYVSQRESQSVVECSEEAKKALKAIADYTEGL